MNEFFSTGLGKTLLIVGIVLLAVLSLGQIMSLRYIGAGITASNTISVSGHGEVMEAPDIAEITFSVVSDKATVVDAQADATTKANAITAYLKSEGLADADIQTSNYSVYPKYEYQSSVCPASSSGTTIACPPGKQVLTGYEASQSTTVKVRDLTKAGDILTAVGQKGATNISGINFTFDNPNKPQDDARAKAIADAKAKADELAKQLGVSIVRVVSFNESSGGGYPRPVAFSTAAGATDAKSVAPEISPGTNTVTDDVTVTYEIR